MSYAHRARKKAIKRGNWNHAGQIARMKARGLNTMMLEFKQDNLTLMLELKQDNLLVNQMRELTS